MSNLFSPSPCAMVICGLYCSMKENMKKDNTFKVTVNGRNEFVNAQDQDHANRIAEQMELRENVERWAADQS